MSGARPVVIAVAPNGARKQRTDHPQLPITPEELADCAEKCLAAGASMLHLHVRDDDGRHSLEPARYRDAIAAIRARVGPELVLQLTTESGGRYGRREQMASAEALEPEAVSVAVRELFADPELLREASAFLGRLAKSGTAVQYILYSVADAERLVRLQAERSIPQSRPHVLFVLGAYAESRAGRPDELPALLAALPPRAEWSVCAFGSAELACVTAGALLGGHVRVGFENNLQLASGSRAADNAALVAASRDVMAFLGLRAATCAEARRLLGVRSAETVESS